MTSNACTMRLTRPLVALALAGGLAAGALGSFSEAAVTGGPTPWALQQALVKKAALPAPLDHPGHGGPVRPGARLLRPEVGAERQARHPHRRRLRRQRWRGEPFRFEAMDLGKYLLFGSQRDFLATADNPLPIREAAKLLKRLRRRHR